MVAISCQLKWIVGPVTTYRYNIKMTCNTYDFLAFSHFGVTTVIIKIYGFKTKLSGNFKPDLKCYTSWLWQSFLPHFGGSESTFVPIPDPGMTIRLGSLELQAIPAHYLHSSGNHHLYDPKAKILFSGDIGAALLPPDQGGLYVEDFTRHIRHAEGFHKRWMGSDRAKRDWCERVSRLDIDMMVPQHGAIYQGADVQRFINWFAALEVGVLRG